MARTARLSFLACTAAFATGFALPALAEPHRGEFRDFHGRVFAHFTRAGLPHPPIPAAPQAA